jgi:hypothetical protein
MKQCAFYVLGFMVCDTATSMIQSSIEDMKLIDDLISFGYTSIDKKCHYSKRELPAEQEMSLP